MSNGTPETLSQMVNMTDEDFMNMDWSFDEESSDSSDTLVEGDSDELPSSDEGLEENTDELDNSEEEEFEQEEGEQYEEESEEELEEESTEEEDTSESNDSELAKLIGSPISAGGSEITLNSVDEAIQLIRMGMEAQNKNQAMAPQRKLLATLQEAKLLDENKINTVIDIMSGNTEALRKLIQDSNINIDDLDKEGPAQYTPNNHSVDDTKLALQEVLTDLRSSEAGIKTLDIVTNQWDNESKQALVDSPSNFRRLAEQVKDGSFDKILGEVSRQKLLGIIPSNTPILAAYAQVGKQLYDGSGNQSQQQAQQPVQQSRQNTTPNNPAGRKRVSKARKTSNRSTNPTIEDLASMSDEDFLKLNFDI